jgi:hypothetical protein
MNKKIERKFYNYMELEEYVCGMWKVARGQQRKDYIKLSEKLMKDTNGFIAAMNMVVKSWPKSVEQNLTVVSSNRLAWLGHAGCNIRHGSPEECTRAAWYLLSDDERNEANKAAMTVLMQWDFVYPGCVQRSLFL